MMIKLAFVNIKSFLTHLNRELIYFFGYVCYRLFFSLVSCFEMMILEEPFEGFSLDLLILSRTLIKAFYFFASPFLLSLIDGDV